MALKRIYIITAEDGEFCLAVCASSSKGAKTYALYHDCFEYLHSEFGWWEAITALSVKWKRDLDEEAIKMPYGEVAWEEALKLELYAFMNESDCPNCGNHSSVVYYNKKKDCFECYNCEQ